MSRDEIAAQLDRLATEAGAARARLEALAGQVRALRERRGDAPEAAADPTADTAMEALPGG